MKTIFSEKKKISPVAAFLLLGISGAALGALFIQTDTQIHRFPVWLVLFLGFLFYKKNKIDLTLLQLKTKQDTALAVAAFVFLFTGFFFFYKMWVFDSHIVWLAGLLHLPEGWITDGIAGGLAVLAFPATLYVFRLLFQRELKADATVRANLKLLRPAFLILCAIFCISIITIIRADYIYKDDMQRLVWGSTVYGRESRFLAEFVSLFLHQSTFYADVSPLTQVLEMILMAAACVIIFMTIKPGKKANWYEICAMVPFALTPYFLEGVSFKYDPPQHAMAVLFAVLPFLFLRQGKKPYLLSTVICMPLLCMSHQVPMAFYPSIVVVIGLLWWNRREKSDKEIGIFIIQSALAYGLGMAIYRFGIMTVLPRNDSFTSTKLWPADQLISGTINNYKKFFLQIYNDFTRVWLVLIIVLCLAFVLELTLHSSRKKAGALAMNTLGLCILLALSYSLYPILAQAKYSPRHMYSFGLFVGLISITAVSLTDLRSFIPKATAVVLSLNFVCFAFVDGNALAEQKTYTEYRVEKVLDTLTEITSESPDETYTVQVIGTTGYGPTITAMGTQQNMIRRLVTTSCDEYYSSWWANGLCSYYGLNIYFWNEDTDPDFRDLDMEVVQDDYYQKISVKDRYILVEMKER